MKTQTCDMKESLLFEGLSRSADNVYIFKKDMQNEYSVWSTNAIAYFGFPDDYNDHVDEIWMEKVHPDDRAGYVKDLESLFRHEKDSHFYQYRVTNARGEYVWVECCGCIETDPDNGNAYFVGIITRLDVTGKYDPITNCLNLKEFYLDDYPEPRTLMLLGLDSFRKIINRIGFVESNVILAKLGEILQRMYGRTHVYRMTGDEFLLSLEPRNKEELEYIFEKIHQELQREMDRIYGQKVSFSGGAVQYFPRREDKNDLLKKLEHSLEYSKQCGKGILTVYSAVIEQQHERVSRVQEALSRAIANNFEGFSLVYQPIVQAKSHKLDGAEALLRFYSEEIGSISPVEFIPLLEASGEIRAVGKWVARTAIEQKKIWDRMHPHLRIGFNVSLLQLQNRALTEQIVKWVKEYQIQPNEIIVELTESRKMQSAEELKDALKPLTDMGIWVFLDDFGMEASTFTLVQELPVDGIKVDHSFVRVMVGSGSERKDTANKAIVSSISYLGRQLGLRVVVEGVENAQIDKLLCNMDIQFMQGYYYSRPISVEEFEAKWISPRFDLRDLSREMPGALLIYKNDPSETIMFASDGLVEMFECDSIEQFLQYTGGSFHNIVHPDDRARVEAEIEAQISADEEKQIDYVEYRIRTIRGNVRHVIDYGHLVDSPKYGKAYFVIITEKKYKS